MTKTHLLDRVICGDALSVLRELPDEIMDVGVTSPPYNKGENKKGWLVANIKYSGASDKLPEAEYQAMQVQVLDELYRIAKPGASFFYNHKIRWERGQLLHPMDWLRKTKWTLRQEIIWDRMIAGNIRGWRFWQVDERIYWLYKPKGGDYIGPELRPQHAQLTSIWRLPPERGNKLHPAPFPIALPVRCIYAVLDSQKEGLVLDPYCGSGTTLVAAKLLGHHYIGIDLSETYCKLAEQRLANYKAEEGAALKEISAHTVILTFKERKAQGQWNQKRSPK